MNSQFEYQESLNSLRFTDEQKEAIARRAAEAARQQTRQARPAQVPALLERIFTLAEELEVTTDLQLERADLEAALFCKAALQASALNVAINTKLMTDRAHAAALDEKSARMLAEYLPLADEVYQSVASRLRA